MAEVGDVLFSGSITGLTQEGGAVGPVAVVYDLALQHYAVEAKDFRIAAGATIGSPGVVYALPAIPAGSEQNLFLIKSDLPIAFQLNGGVPTYEIRKANGVFCMSPGFAVTSIEFGNAGASEAKVYILQVVGD